MNYEWLQHLKPGDDVVVMFLKQQILNKVDTISNGTIQLRDTDRAFDLKTGEGIYSYSGGLTVNPPYLVEATTELVARLRDAETRKDLIRKIKTADFSRVSTDELMLILATVTGFDGVPVKTAVSPSP